MQVQPDGMLRGAVQCGAGRAVRVAGESRGQATATGVGRTKERERELGVDKGLAWALSFFARQFEDQGEEREKRPRERETYMLQEQGSITDEDAGIP